MKTRELADFLDSELCGDGNTEIARVADLEHAGPGDLAFVENGDKTVETSASCVIVPLGFSGELLTPFIKAKDPKLAFALAAAKLHPSRQRYFGHQTAIVAPTADVRTTNVGDFVVVGENSFVDEGCEIGHGAKIGSNVKIHAFTIVHSNCVIYDNVEIGRNCVLHSGVVVGADGFGYVRDNVGDYRKFPQIGAVVIEDYVEIGANTCIDRGALGETRIGAGTKIDNLVQIAHNVQIGKRVVIAAQTGISGSTVIEDDCVIGGQVGMGDHARVLRGAVIGSQAGVLPGKIVRPGVWWGTPVQPLDEYKRQIARIKGLERLNDKVKELSLVLKSSKTEPDGDPN